MELRNERELTTARLKLQRLEALYESAETETGDDEEIREAEMDSIKGLINQLKEEITRYQTRHQAVQR
jgi:hypothetical protein